MGCLGFFHRLANLGGFGNVAGEKVDLVPLVGLDQEIQTMGIFGQVENPDLAPLVEQPFRNPGPDAAVTTSHQNSHDPPPLQLSTTPRRHHGTTGR